MPLYVLTLLMYPTMYVCVYLVRMSLFCFQQCSRLLIILNCWLILGTNAEVDISLRTAQYNAKMEEIVCNAETNISSRIAILSKISLKYTFYEAGNLTSKSVGRESPFRRKQQMGGQFLKSDLDRYGCEAENWYYGACIVSETLERIVHAFKRLHPECLHCRRLRASDQPDDPQQAIQVQPR